MSAAPAGERVPVGGAGGRGAVQATGGQFSGRRGSSLGDPGSAAPAAPLSAVVYYMEGRDSMQLIYRWTKSLDPGLKKGLWAPEEDAVRLWG